ncbi:hypothetical protein D3C71_1953280 [compost metagenome]
MLNFSRPILGHALLRPGFGGEGIVIGDGNGMLHQYILALIDIDSIVLKGV